MELHQGISPFQGANIYVSSYREIRTLSPRQVLRGFALSALAITYRWSGHTGRLLGKNRVQILYLHHVFEDEEGAFCHLLDRLGRDHRFLSYPEAVTRIREGPIDDAYLALSFDDGLKSCLRAAEILEERGLTACFFVCPSVVGETDYRRVAEFCGRIKLPPCEVLSWDDVEKLKRQGHEIGSHSLSHQNLAQLQAEQLMDEIEGSYEVLSRRLGEVKHFSWPLGRFSHMSPQAARAVFAAGFESCTSAERGCHVEPANGDPARVCIRRDHVIARWPPSHVEYFLARNSLKASPVSNAWPDGWDSIIADGADACES